MFRTIFTVKTLFIPSFCGKTPGFHLACARKKDSGHAAPLDDGGLSFTGFGPVKCDYETDTGDGDLK
jgi:hypothetical protein